MRDPTTVSAPRTGDTTMKEYEILIAGPIGPVAASCLPEFSSVTGPTATVLAGTVPDPDDVRAVTERLRARGLEPLAVRIGPKRRADE